MTDPPVRDKTCRICHTRLTPVYPGQRTHPECCDEGRTLSAWIANGYRWTEHSRGRA